MKPIILAVDRSSRLVRQLLALARLDAQDQVSQSDRIEPVEMLHRVIAGVSPRGDVTVAVSEDEQAPPIATNAEYLELAVRNLHENAVQHTHPGGAVRWRLGGAALTVENDGPIIPPDERAQIGTRFFRGPNRHPAGSGLGLAIARAALGKIGALVTAENRSDRGGVVCTIVLDGERPLPLTPP